MTARWILAAALIAALIAAGCGGSTGTQPRTSAGVEQMADAFAAEVRDGNPSAACTQYLTVASQALVKAFLGDCGKAMKGIAAENGGSAGVEKEWVTVTGDRAVWHNPSDGGDDTVFAYGGDHRWRIDLADDDDTGGGFE